MDTDKEATVEAGLGVDKRSWRSWNLFAIALNVMKGIAPFALFGRSELEKVQTNLTLSLPGFGKRKGPPERALELGRAWEEVGRKALELINWGAAGHPAAFIR